MNDAPSSVLLVEDDAANARLVLGALKGADRYRVEWATRLSTALERLHRGGVDLVLLDLTLPDGQGLEAFDRVFQAVPEASILVLSAAGEETLARQAVRRGALDFIIKSHVDAHWLPRALRYAVERKAAEDALRLSEARFRALTQEALFEEQERAQVTLDSIGDAVLCTDLSANVTYLNRVAEAMTGWSREEALGRPLSEVLDIIDGTTRRVAVNPARRTMAQDRTVTLATDCVLIRRDGFEIAIEDSAAPIHNRHGRVAGAVIVFRDVSESRSIRSKMAHLAQHDSLTGLPNRALLRERLSQAVRLAQRHRKPIALLFLDLDDFKTVNDSLGHAIGDQLLESVAGRLATCVRATDTISRLGGDEFVILLAELEQPRDAVQVAEKLLAAFALPHFIAGHELNVTLSIGISIYPGDGSNIDTLMQNADTAMYSAKAGGRNQHQSFRADMKTSAIPRLQLESSL